MFEETAQPIIESVLGGYNGTIFAYGQTGAGDAACRLQCCGQLLKVIMQVHEVHSSNLDHSPLHALQKIDQAPRQVPHANALLHPTTLAGKKFTMEGRGGDDSAAGIVPRTFAAVYAAIAGSSSRQYLVRASFLELYKEEIRFACTCSASSELATRHSVWRLSVRRRAGDVQPQLHGCSCTTYRAQTIFMHRWALSGHADLARPSTCALQL